MDLIMKNKVVCIQKRFLGAIRSHKICYEKVQKGDSSENLRQELVEIRQQIMACHEEQKVLLDQLNRSSQSEPHNFNLYPVPAGARKTRRRKDVIQVKLEDEEVILEPIPMRARSPSVSSKSSESVESSDPESDEELSQNVQPLPLANPTLLPTSLSRHDVRLPKHRRLTTLTRQQREELSKQLPVYPPTTPTPPPKDEKEAKMRYMAAVKLIPKEALSELLTRKTERKRRSAANSSYIYNNEWEVPTVKRKQYLSPNKTKSPPKVEKDKKCAAADDLTAGSSQLESDDDRQRQCNICQVYDDILSCMECLEQFHPKCISVPELDQSFLLCPRCNRNKKCPLPNLHTLQPASPLHPTDLTKPPDYSATTDIEMTEEVSGENSIMKEFEDKKKLRLKLYTILRARNKELAQMEKKVLALSESIALQHRLSLDLEQEEKEIISKTRKITNTLALYLEKPRIASADPIDQESSLPLNLSQNSSSSTSPTPESTDSKETSPARERRKAKASRTDRKQSAKWEKGRSFSSPLPDSCHLPMVETDQVMEPSHPLISAVKSQESLLRNSISRKLDLILQGGSESSCILENTECNQVDGNSPPLTNANSLEIEGLCDEEDLSPPQGTHSVQPEDEAPPSCQSINSLESGEITSSQERDLIESGQPLAYMFGHSSVDTVDGSLPELEQDTDILTFHN